MTSNAALLARLIDVIGTDIVPLTADGVKRGNKLFGAAILRKSDLSLVIAETNNEIENPLWHGEMHALKKLYERGRENVPAPKDCIFLATHEPCSLCLSAITWSGYDNFYYLFSYENSRDDFAIPHDLNILKEVFALPTGNYPHQNAYWTAHDIVEEVNALPRSERGDMEQKIAGLRDTYAGLSAVYQASKSEGNDIPLA